MYVHAPIDDLVAALKAAGIRAGVDPASLQAPAVWVQPLGGAIVTLDGSAQNVRLVGILPDQTVDRAYRAVVDHVNQVSAVVHVHAYDTRSVLMPDGALLPGWETNIALRAPIPAPE